MLFDSRARESKWKQKRATRSHVAPVINVRVNSRLVRDRKVARYDTGRCVAGMAYRIVKPIRTGGTRGPISSRLLVDFRVYLSLPVHTSRHEAYIVLLERGCLAYCTIIR